MYLFCKYCEKYTQYLTPPVNPRGAEAGDVVLELQGKYFLNVNMF